MVANDLEVKAAVSRGVAWKHGVTGFVMTKFPRNFLPNASLILLVLVCSMRGSSIGYDSDGPAGAIFYSVIADPACAFVLLRR